MNIESDIPDPETSDTVRVYDVNDDGMVRIERVTRTEYPSGVHSRTTVGVADLEVLAAFPGDVPVIDMETCDGGLAAFGEELVA